MDAGMIIAIVVGVLVLIAAIVLATKMGRERRLDTKRQQSREVRREAQIRGARAERQAAEADERAARARREQAIAEEQSAEAEKDRRFAREPDFDPVRRREPVRDEGRLERDDRSPGVERCAYLVGDDDELAHSDVQTSGSRPLTKPACS